MAKTLSTQSVAVAFAEYDAMIVISGIGGPNKDGVRAVTHSIFVTADARENATEYRNYCNRHWISKAGAKMSDSDKLDLYRAYPGDFSPSEPKTQTPLRQAVQNILARAHNVTAVSEMALREKMAFSVNKFLANANLEKYRDQIDAELIAVRDATGLRTIKGSGDGETGEVEYGFETSDDAVDEAA